MEDPGKLGLGSRNCGDLGHCQLRGKAGQKVMATFFCRHNVFPASVQTVTERRGKNVRYGCQKFQGKWREEGRKTGSHRNGEMLKKAFFPRW